MSLIETIELSCRHNETIFRRLIAMATIQPNDYALADEVKEFFELSVEDVDVSIIKCFGSYLPFNIHRKGSNSKYHQCEMEFLFSELLKSAIYNISNQEWLDFAQSVREWEK